MLGLSSKRVGLVISQSDIRYVAANKRKTWEVGRNGRLALPEGLIVEGEIANWEELLSVLKPWVKAERLNGYSASFLLPTSHIIVRRMSIPTTNQKELGQLIRLEVETALHLPFEDPVYDYTVISMEEESTNILLFAASRRLVASYSELLETAGLHVCDAEVPAMALARAILTQQEVEFQDTMLIHLEGAALEVYMFHEMNPVFMRALVLNEQQTLEGDLSEGQVEEVMAELSRMLNFYQFGMHDGASRIANAVITGAKLGRAKLIQALQANQPEMKVDEASFAPIFGGGESEPEHEAYRMAFGLAVTEPEAFRVNLLPRLDREARLLPGILTAAILVWVACAGLIGYNYADNKSQVADQNESISKLQDQIKLTENGLIASSSKQTGSGNPIEAIEAIKKQQIDAVKVLDQLQQPLPLGAKLNSISYNDTGKISLILYFNSLPEISKYLYDLGSLNLFNRPQLQAISSNTANPAASTSDTPSLMKMYTANIVVQLKSAETGASDGSNN